jgi:hypothetical protein
MPQLVVIKSAKKGAIGEVVGVYEDSHVFTAREKAEFHIVNISNEKKTEYLSLLPVVRTAFKSSTTDWTLDSPEVVEVWNDNGNWCEVKEKHVRPILYQQGTFVNQVKNSAANKSILVPKVK